MNDKSNGTNISNDMFSWRLEDLEGGDLVKVTPAATPYVSELAQEQVLHNIRTPGKYCLFYVLFYGLFYLFFVVYGSFYDLYHALSHGL